MQAVGCRYNYRPTALYCHSIECLSTFCPVPNYIYYHCLCNVYSAYIQVTSDCPPSTIGPSLLLLPVYLKHFFPGAREAFWSWVSQTPGRRKRCELRQRSLGRSPALTEIEGAFVFFLFFWGVGGWGEIRHTHEHQNRSSFLTSVYADPLLCTWRHRGLSP